jgi:cyclic pyranopterin phosphate synthase
VPDTASVVPDTASAATGPAKYYTIDGFRGRIGFISALSSCFCGSCNRLRLDCTGQLRPCLASNSGCDLSEAVRDAARFGDTGAVEKLILATVAKKPARHNFAERGAGAVEMYKIGG